ncbi:MAG: hypothetical protein K0R82_1686 [Flavipsychrobacter sp.]|nr:hypothetical protein [Flavipsychrobacter sp.]
MVYLDERLHSIKQFSCSSFEVVVDENAVELRGEAKLETGFADALFEAVHGFGSALLQPLPEYLQRGCLYEYGERSVGVGILDG